MSEFFIDKEYEYTNRFDLERFVEFKNGYFDILQSPLIGVLKTLPTIGVYVIREYPYRPEVVSYNLYKDHQYWPYLMFFNGISNVMDLKLGLSLKYFSLSDLEKILYSLLSKNEKI